MSQITVSLTVFFEEPFWVGLYERTCIDCYGVYKITFGSEPRDYEVYAILLQDWHKLHVSPPVDSGPADAKRMNPKRVQRSIKHRLSEAGVGTKAQQTLKLEHEQNKLLPKTYSNEKHEAEQRRKFFIRQQKRKEKHRGH
ncbi:MAG TPA: YjdF family protein [Clostridia bacterium]|nr:YjdF family protein [Clostridia bacterium]